MKNVPKRLWRNQSRIKYRHIPLNEQLSTPCKTVLNTAISLSLLRFLFFLAKKFITETFNKFSKNGSNTLLNGERHVLPSVSKTKIFLIPGRLFQCLV